MIPKHSVLCDIAFRDLGNKVRRVDLKGLFRRLLLFEKVIIKSVSLQEVPILVSAFQKDGLKQLVEAGVLQFSVEDSMIIIDVKRDGVSSLRPFEFNFGQATLHNPDQKLRNQLAALESVAGLNQTDRISLEASIWSTLFRSPSNYIPNIMTQSEEDLRTNKLILSAAVNQLIKREFGGAAPSCSLKIEEVSPRVFCVLNDLEMILAVSQQKAHDILVAGMLGATELNHRLEDMSVHSAITGFNEKEAPLLFKKLAGILSSQNPQILEKQLARVETILNLPEISPETPINVPNLMKARESSEIQEFQAWLYKFEGKSDEEIQKLVHAVGLRVSSLLRGKPGKALRFAVTTALGLIPGAGLVLGPVSGAIDTFVVDQVLPTSGVFGFLTEIYPSLFHTL